MIFLTPIILGADMSVGLGLIEFMRKQPLGIFPQYECPKDLTFQCPLCPRKCKRNDILVWHLKHIHRIGET